MILRFKKKCPSLSNPKKFIDVGQTIVMDRVIGIEYVSLGFAEEVHSLYPTFEIVDNTKKK